LALLLRALRDEFGPWVALGTAVLLALSDWIVFFGRNLYWAAPLLLLPAAFSWRAYPRLPPAGPRRLRYFGMLGVLVLLKSLCGYEYLSNVILSALPAV